MIIDSDEEEETGGGDMRSENGGGVRGEDGGGMGSEDGEDVGMDTSTCDSDKKKTGASEEVIGGCKIYFILYLIVIVK